MTEPAAPPPSSPAVALWEDFVDILYAPAEVFSRRERGKAWMPLIVVTLLLGGLFVVNSRLLEPIMEAEFQRGMAAALRRNPQLTPEMLERGRAFGTAFAMIAAFVFPPLIMLFTGLALWVGGKLVDAATSVRAALMVAAYAYVPKVFDALVAGLQGLFLDPSHLDGRYRVSLGVGRFLDPDTVSPVLIALLGRVDVFTIWVTVLLAIGLSVTGKISRASAAIAATFVWVVGAVPGLLQALRS